MRNSREGMLVAFGIGVFAFAFWTAGLIYHTLTPDFPRDPDTLDVLLAIALLWPLGEVIWTWRRMARHPGEYVSKDWRLWGDVLVMVALILPPAMTLALMDYEYLPLWLLITQLVITVLGCHAARLLWSRADRQGLQT